MTSPPRKHRLAPPLRGRLFFADDPVHPIGVRVDEIDHCFPLRLEIYKKNYFKSISYIYGTDFAYWSSDRHASAWRRMTLSAGCFPPMGAP